MRIPNSRSGITYSLLCGYIVLFSLGLADKAKAQENNNNNNNNGTQKDSKLDVSQPRDNSIMVVEYADLNQLVVDDRNFKALIKHCLKSQDSKACEVMSSWDVSRVSDCSYLFWEEVTKDDDEEEAESSYVLIKGAETFDVDISSWDTSSCTTMKGMFQGAESFNKPIGNWHTSRVTDMSYMFDGARVFNQDIRQWHTGSVRDMSAMFRRASRFHNSDLTLWDTSRVTDMSSMFESAGHFNGDIRTFNVARVQHFGGMFHNADMFNQFVGEWDVSGAFDNIEHDKYAFASMFDGARDFDQDVSHWDVRGAQSLGYMFRNAYSFDQDLSAWDVKGITNLMDMFQNARSFQQVLCWDVTGKETGSMFEGTLAGGVDTAIFQCREEKSKERMDINDSNKADSTVPKSTESTYKAPSFVIGFLRKILIVALAATALFFVILVRRYYTSKKRQKQMVQQIVNRAHRSASASGVSPSSIFIPKYSAKVVSNKSHDMVARKEEGQTKFAEQSEEGQFCGIDTAISRPIYHRDGNPYDVYYVNDGYESEETEVEILFENPLQQDELRRSVFENSFAPSFFPKDDGMMAIEHAIPAMTTLLQMQQEQQQHQQQQHRQQLERRNSQASAATIPTANTGKLLTQNTILVPAPFYTSPPVLQPPPPPLPRVYPYPSILQTTGGHAIVRTSDALVTKKKRIRVPLRKLLKHKNSSNYIRRKEPAAAINAAPPMYKVPSEGEGGWVYQDVADASSACLRNDGSIRAKPDEADIV